MTAAELRQARNRLGVSGAEFARAFDVSERTLRSWEGAIHNKRLIPVPRAVAILTKLALKNPSIRRELGLAKAKAPQPMAKSDPQLLARLTCRTLTVWSLRAAGIITPP